MWRSGRVPRERPGLAVKRRSCCYVCDDSWGGDAGGFFEDCFRLLSRETKRVQRLFPALSADHVPAMMMSELWHQSAGTPASPTSSEVQAGWASQGRGLGQE